MCFIVLQFVTSVKTAGRNYVLCLFCYERGYQISRFPKMILLIFSSSYEKHYLSTHNLCDITHDSYHSIGEKIRYANN